MSPRRPEFGTGTLANGLTQKQGPEPMTAADRDYFLARAEAELDLANAATHARAAFAHYHLADFYLDRAWRGPANDD